MAQQAQQLDRNWKILQDVHDLGEKSRIFLPGWVETDVFTLFSEWEPIDYLSHLQVLLSDHPYFGRELRYFNHAPWWYKNEFFVPANALPHALLRFEGVDYYCKIWLNGEFIGEHEGYSSPFDFEVGHLLKRGCENLLIVKVSSPWDNDVLHGKEYRRVHKRICGMFKGTYEHDDTFIARDVNPVGIWNDVSVLYHDGLNLSGPVQITALTAENLEHADISVSVSLHSACMESRLAYRAAILDRETGLVVSEQSSFTPLVEGPNQLSFSFPLDRPRIWEMWERGKQNLYDFVLEIYRSGSLVLNTDASFGIRKAELMRTAKQIQFRLNGRDVFLRGASYFPDVYVSRMSRERYRRDILAAKAAGINALRVHVHVAKKDFYDLCDELGMLVVQDSDFNWTVPVDSDWTERAVRIFSDMVRGLYNHPSIVCWIVMNEPQEPEFMELAPGPQLVSALRRLDPTRPYIKGSGPHPEDPESGDIHDYTGAFGDETYLQYNVKEQRLNTEFGMDAPPVPQNLRLIPKLYKRVKPLDAKVSELQYYQYRLLKHVIEQFRLHKNEPCSGYFQFMFIDLCPQSWYGVYDWWGVPKEGLKAFEESNQPVGVFMDVQDGAVRFWAVNDTMEAYEGLTFRWSIADESKGSAKHGMLPALLESNGSKQLLFSLPADFEPDSVYRITLVLEDPAGNVVARNRYNDPFHHPEHPKGHYNRMSHELGVRLFDA